MAETIESLERKIKQNKEKLAELKAKERSQDRTRRNHALYVVGGLVESYFDDWTEIGLGRLKAFLDAHVAELDGCKAERIDTKAAAARVRKWEENEREEKKKAKSAGVRSQFAPNGELATREA